MIRCLVIGWPLALLSSLAVRAEQPSDGSPFRIADPASFSGTIDLSPPDKARVVVARYSACLLRHQKTKVRSFLALPPDFKEAGELGNRLAVRECLLSGTIRFNVTLLRGGLFGVMYRQTFGRQTPELVAAQPSAPDWQYPGDIPFGATQRFAECVVRADYLNSRALVVAPVASTEETAAFQALRPKLGDCLKNEQLMLSKTQLEGYLAEALYEMSVGPQSAAR